MTHLQVSTSPRCTWLWASDPAAADRARHIAGGQPATRYGKPVPNVLDVDIGTVALETCQRLAAAGYTFTWHPNEHPLNRDNWPHRLPGMEQQHAGSGIWIREGKVDRAGPVEYRRMAIHRAAAHIGAVDFWACSACHQAYLGKVSFVDAVKGRGLGTWLLAQLRLELHGYHWRTTAQDPTSEGFWQHIQRAYPGEYDDAGDICSHIRADI